MLLLLLLLHIRNGQKRGTLIDIFQTLRVFGRRVFEDIYVAVSVQGGLGRLSACFNRSGGSRYLLTLRADHLWDVGCDCLYDGSLGAGRFRTLPDVNQNQARKKGTIHNIRLHVASQRTLQQSVVLVECVFPKYPGTVEVRFWKSTRCRLS